jgi:uncharacterized protein
MTESDRSVLSMVRSDLSSIYGERLAGLIMFGSRARGDNDVDSDYDILVLLQGVVQPYKELKFVNELLSRLSLATRSVISCCFANVNDYKDKDYELYIAARTEGIAF